jgi:hypothetical protein
VGSSGVRAYIAQVDRLLAAGQGLFPHGGPGVEVRNAGEGGVPAAPPGPSGMSFGPVVPPRIIAVPGPK